MPLSIIDKAKNALVIKLIEQLMGEPPIVHYYPDYTEIDFSDNQVVKGKNFLDSQIISALKPKPTNAPLPKLQIRIGKIIVPWSMERGMPILAGSFGLGYLTKKFTGRKKKK